MLPNVNKGGNTIQSHLRPITYNTSLPCSGSTPLLHASVGHPTPTDVTMLKSELILGLRKDVMAIFKAELQAALVDNLSSVKTELFALTIKFSSSIAIMQQNFAGLKGTVAEMEQSLSTSNQNGIFD